MSARDIDLDYTDDGQTLERVLLTGSAALAMTGQNGGSGRQMIGETLDVVLAPDGAVTKATGREKVQLDMPASDGVAARTVKSRLLDGDGEPGKGLTAARFTDNVEYREEARQGAAPRVARSNALQVTFENDAINSALFTGACDSARRGCRRRAPRLATIRTRVACGSPASMQAGRRASPMSRSPSRRRRAST